MNPRDYSIRRMTPNEVSIAIEWAAREGWNPGHHDAACFHAADPTGFFLGELDGEPVGCISAIAYDDCFGFVGFYIVKPGFRGQGLGLPLWSAAMEYLAVFTRVGEGVSVEVETKSG